MTTDDIADRERLEGLGRLLGQRHDVVVLDVGANGGQFASELLTIGAMEVHCFEPVASAFAELSQRFAENPNVRPVRKAVDETPGSAEMFVTASTVGSSLLAPVAGQQSSWAQVAATDTVEVVRLDQFIEQAGIAYIDLLKVDTQGTDERVLRSAGRYLQPGTIGAVLVELNFHAFYEQQGRVHTILQLLEDSGYFLAEFYRHYNRQGWLWWADGLFLPNAHPYSTQFGEG